MRLHWILLALSLLSPEGAGQTFHDVAPQAGVTFSDYNTAASAWRDYDGDGDEDFFLPINGGSYQPNDILAQNDGMGHFVDVAASAGVQGHANLSFQLAAAWGDYDNDGDPDLFVTNTPEPYQFFRNDGDGTFTDVAAAAGLTANGTGGNAAVWADVDNDGWLDLFVAVWGSPNHLFHANGDGTFTDIAASAGVAHGTAASPGGVFADYDGDGDLDLYSCSVDSNDPGRLFRNEGDLTFTDVTASAGIAPIRARAAIWGDFDNDGDFDLYITDVVTGAMTGYHYVNQGNGSFVESGMASGLRFYLAYGLATRGASAADYDNDGDLDVFITMTNTAGGTVPPANLLFRNSGFGQFSEVGSVEGVADTKFAEGSSWADYDDDGDLDLFVANDWPQACLLYRNDTSSAHWTRLRLQGVKSNRDTVGAVVRLQAGGKWQVRQVDGGGTGVNCQDSLPVEFGLGSATRIDTLEIEWPSGIDDIYHDLAVDVEHTFVEKTQAEWTNYGSGWPGTKGVPAFTASDDPVLGTLIDLAIENSLGAATAAYLALGWSEASIPTNLDGTLLVDPISFIPVTLPPATLLLPAAIPGDPAFCGFEVYLQVLEADPGATKGASFTEGLLLLFGY